MRFIIFIYISRNKDLPDISNPVPVMKYSQGNISHQSHNNNIQSSEPALRYPQTNLSTTSSTSMANLSSTETLLMAGHARKRTGNNTGKLARLGRLERSKSAPSLNGRFIYEDFLAVSLR